MTAQIHQSDRFAELARGHQPRAARLRTARAAIADLTLDDLVALLRERDHHDQRRIAAALKGADND